MSPLRSHFEKFCFTQWNAITLEFVYGIAFNSTYICISSELIYSVLDVFPCEQYI